MGDPSGRSHGVGLRGHPHRARHPARLLRVRSAGSWFVLIGLFLRQSAESSYQQLVLRGGLSPYAVRDVMTRDVLTVPAEATAAEVIDHAFWKHHVSSFPVIDGGA